MSTATFYIDIDERANEEFEKNNTYKEEQEAFDPEPI